jgi:hypothetical protein
MRAAILDQTPAAWPEREHRQLTAEGGDLAPRAAEGWAGPGVRLEPRGERSVISRQPGSGGPEATAVAVTVMPAATPVQTPAAWPKREHRQLIPDS